MAKELNFVSIQAGLGGREDNLCVLKGSQDKPHVLVMFRQRVREDGNVVNVYVADLPHIFS